MAIADPMLKDRFAGCLLGLAIGDALGGKFEAQSADAIRARFSSVEQLIAYPQEEIWYRIILLGGDTDTLAAMAGALSGAYLGAGRLPSRLVGLLESSPKGRTYLKELSGRLLAVYDQARS